MTLLRYLRILALALWIGGFFFFAMAVAPLLFAVLPTHYLAGLVVGRALASLHWIGIVCALVYLLNSSLLELFQGGSSPFRRRDLLLVGMLAMTLFLQFGYQPRMLKLRDSMGIIDNVPQNDPRRVEFNRMHVWSTRMEGAVFFLGLALLYCVVREQETSPRRY